MSAEYRGDGPRVDFNSGRTAISIAVGCAVILGGVGIGMRWASGELSPWVSATPTVRPAETLTPTPFPRAERPELAPPEIVIPEP